MKYDDAEIYLLDCETEFADADEVCRTHLGFYLASIVNSAMVSNRLTVHAEPARQRTSSGRTLLVERCDGKLPSDDLNERGNAFTQTCYESTYFSDYQEIFTLDTEDPEAQFRVADTEPIYLY